MKKLSILFLSLLVSTNAHSFDCTLLPEKLLGIPLNSKLEKLDGYVATKLGSKGERSLTSFWKKDGKAQESIKVHRYGDATYMISANFGSYNQEDALSKLTEIASRIGQSNLTQKENDPRPFYYVNCNGEMSASLFISEWHAKQPVSYVVSFFIQNETIHNDIAR